MKINKRFASVSLFFVIVTIALPSPAQAGLFTWKAQAKTLNVSTASSQNSSWSFENLFSDNDSGEISELSANLLLGSDMMLKKPVRGTPATPGLTYLVEASAYSSTPDQTDESPFITAKGTHVRAGIVAANFLPFGTVIRIPEVFGDRDFVVEDRMNTRYQKHVDIWFPDRLSAMEFGRRRVVIEIVSN